MEKFLPIVFLLGKKMPKRRVDEYKRYAKQLHQKKHSIHNY